MARCVYFSSEKTVTVLTAILWPSLQDNIFYIKVCVTGHFVCMCVCIKHVCVQRNFYASEYSEFKVSF